MTSENEYRLGRRAYHQHQEENPVIVLAVVAIRQDLNSPAIVQLVFDGGVKATLVL